MQKNATIILYWDKSDYNHTDDIMIPMDEATLEETRRAKGLQIDTATGVRSFIVPLQRSGTPKIWNPNI